MGAGAKSLNYFQSARFFIILMYFSAMKTLRIYLILLLSVYSFQALANTSFLRINNGVNLHIGVYEAYGAAKMDAIYLPGYADVFTNHEELFDNLNQQGIRVISFDYPNHGKTEVTIWNDLNLTTFTELASYVEEVEQKTREDKTRPLALIGWSTGGLLATRILQGLGSLNKTRKITHAALITPGVSVYTCVGDKLCTITNRTLTHDQNLMDRPISPLTPLTRPKFGAALMLNAHKSWENALPSKTKTLVFVAGDKTDKYAKSPQIKKWVEKQRSKFSSPVRAIQCNDAFHEMHNETNYYGGDQTKNNITNFLKNKIVKVQGRCRSF